MHSNQVKSSQLKSPGLGIKEFKKDSYRTQQEKDAKKKEILRRVQQKALARKNAEDLTNIFDTMNLSGKDNVEDLSDIFGNMNMERSGYNFDTEGITNICNNLRRTDQFTANCLDQLYNHLLRYQNSLDEIALNRLKISINDIINHAETGEDLMPSTQTLCRNIAILPFESDGSDGSEESDGSDGSGGSDGSDGSGGSDGSAEPSAPSDPIDHNLGWHM
jgi:uncharacterized membrane protein YgcG